MADQTEYWRRLGEQFEAETEEIRKRGEQARARIKAMTTEEKRQMLIKAGILDESGELSEFYRD
jgi:hypothetical protein